MFQYEIDNQEEDNFNPTINAERENLLNDILNKIENNLVRFVTEQNMRGITPIPEMETGGLSAKVLI